jgi:GT2 family glycosyltransferase
VVARTIGTLSVLCQEPFMSPTGPFRDPRGASLRWQIANNRAAGDRAAQLPAEVEQLRDFLLGLRRSRTWRLIRWLRALKHGAAGRRVRDPVEQALARLSAVRPAPVPAAGALLPLDTGYPDWIATVEPGLHARLLGDGAAPVAIDVIAPGTVPPAGAARFTALCDPQDALAPDALRIAGAVLAGDPDIDLLYADLDHIDAAGARHRPDFRPDWDPDLHLGRDILSGLLVCRTELLRRPGMLEGLPAWPLGVLSLRLAEASRPGHIGHVPAVLCHRRTPRPASAWLEAVAWHVGAERVESLPQGLRIRRKLPRPRPRVSVLVPTRDRADLLGPCLDGLLRRTDYPELELVVIDNGSTQPAALALLAHAAGDPRVRVVRCDEPFNWSRLNNAGARVASGAVLVLMNNDTAVLHADWLDELVAQAMRPEIGAVGPMLLYPGGRVQHAGMAFDDHGANRHLFRGRDRHDPGPQGMLALVREVSAVTGACLAVRRELYEAVGGASEALAVGCNDVDLCLRLQALGYRTLWTPFAMVEHCELASRGADSSPGSKARAAQEIRHLRRDWYPALSREPCINPNLVIVEEELWLRGAND